MSFLFWSSCTLLFASVVLCAVRMIIGPELADRVVAVDLLTNLLMAGIALLSIYSNQVMYLDVIAAIALVMFLSSTMYARYLEKTNKLQEAQDYGL